MLRVLLAAGANLGEAGGDRVWRVRALHCTVVSTVATAAGGQGKIVAQIESEREGSSSEEEHQQDGKGAPHPSAMLHDFRFFPRSGKKMWFQVSSMHPEFRLID